MKIKVSGDTIIKILLKKYDAMNISTCSSTTQIDDFAFKKRHNYGTIIAHKKTHNPVAILDGRDGKTLSEWLKQNKHIKTFTRDRASVLNIKLFDASIITLFDAKKDSILQNIQ